MVRCIPQHFPGVNGRTFRRGRDNGLSARTTKHGSIRSEEVKWTGHERMWGGYPMASLIRSVTPLKAGMYTLAAVVGFVGLLFLVGNQGLVARMFIGIVLMGAGVAIGWLTKAKAPERKIVQQIDLSGEIEKEQLECNSCGAPLNQDSIELHEGAITVNCPYCGTSYQLEEAPKW